MESTCLGFRRPNRSGYVYITTISASTPSPAPIPTTDGGNPSAPTWMAKLPWYGAQAIQCSAVEASSTAMSRWPSSRTPDSGDAPGEGVLGEWMERLQAKAETINASGAQTARASIADTVSPNAVEERTNPSEPNSRIREKLPPAASTLRRVRLSMMMLTEETKKA